MSKLSEVFSRLLDQNVGPALRFENYAELAKEAGVSSSFISAVKLGKNKHPDQFALKKLSSILGVDLNAIWFDENLGLTPRGGPDAAPAALPELREHQQEKEYGKPTFILQQEKALKDHAGTPLEALIVRPERYRLVPVFDTAAGPFAQSAEPDQYNVGMAERLMFTASKDPNAFVVEIHGDSMIGAGLQEGDLALVEPNHALENGDLCVCVCPDRGTTLKRFYRQGDKIVLQPANPVHAPRVLTEAEYADVRCYHVGRSLRITEH